MRRWLERESLLIVVLALYAGVVTVALPQELSQDGWLALVCGREVAQHGLPSHDALNVLTMGARWTDQQWLGQLALYGLGVRGALLAHAAVVTAALAGAAAYARRAGASVNAVARVAVLVVATLGLLPMRTQTFGYALFVAVLALLCADVRRPGRRVLWVLPLLALWANVHGSVLLGAALVGLRALFGLRRAPARSLALVAVAVAGPLLSPYGLDLVHYYRATFANPQFRDLVGEWRASAPSLATAPYYGTVVLLVWLAARHPRRLAPYELVVLALLALSAATSLRNIPWFALAALMLGPALLEAEIRPGEPAAPGFRRAIGAGALALAAVALAVVAAQPQSWLTARFPARAADDAATGRRVFATETYADWLLWRHPELRGRIAYDARFELLTGAQLRAIVRFKSEIGDGWRAAARGYDVLVLDAAHARDALRGLRRRYADGRVVVAARE